MRGFLLGFSAILSEVMFEISRVSLILSQGLVILLVLDDQKELHYISDGRNE